MNFGMLMVIAYFPALSLTLRDLVYARQNRGTARLHLRGQERVFTTKTAEGACATLNGGLNAQAKGLATALRR